MAQAIPDRHNFYILKGQDMVKYDGVIDLGISIFELKMSLKGSSTWRKSLMSFCMY